MKKLISAGLVAVLVTTATAGAVAAQEQNDQAYRRSRPASIAAAVIGASGGVGDYDRNGRDYDILLGAVLALGLDAALADPEADLTVFAPNDRAFRQLALELGFNSGDEAAVLGFLAGSIPTDVLTNVVLYHVVGRSLNPLQVLFAGKITTLADPAAGENVIRPRFLSLRDGDRDDRDPRLVLRQLNIRTGNGVIHGIDGVLRPIDLP